MGETFRECLKYITRTKYHTPTYTSYIGVIWETWVNFLFGYPHVI